MFCLFLSVVNVELLICLNHMAKKEQSNNLAHMVLYPSLNITCIVFLFKFLNKILERDVVT
jgi:hypothetical protein